MATPQPSKKLKRPATSAQSTQPAPAQLGTANSSGSGIMTATTPQAPAPAAAQSADVYNQNSSANIAADIERRSSRAISGFQSGIAGLDTSGQFGAGTIPSEQQRATGNLSAAQSAFSGVQSPYNTALGGSSMAKAPIGVSQTPMASNLTPPLSTTPGTVPSKVETAADQATSALGPAPQVDLGLADRRLGEYQESLGMSREVIDRLLNGPSTAERLGSQTLRSQLALARSARGGPGAVQQALSQAQQQAPEMQAAAIEQARQEELSKLTAAGNVASNFAQAALGARGQDVNIAGKNVDAGLSVKGMITQLTGTQLELDQRNTEMLGQMARDLAALQFDWASLDAQQSSAALDRYLQIYGIDANYRAQIKAIEAAGKITSKDILNSIVGVVAAGASVGAAAAGKK